MEVREASASYTGMSEPPKDTASFGFIQTEAGLIPEDWVVLSLGQILLKKQLGGNYKNSEIETQWPLIKMGNLGRGRIKLDKIEFVDTSQSPADRDRLELDDVLFNTRNTLELVGKVALWRNELPEAYFNSNIMRMEFEASLISSNRFMNYFLNTPHSISALRAMATGTTSVAAIYSRDFVNLTVAIPSKSEQQAIAEALSDADALIESLQQLIAKKRQIKQGTMQALLTDKQRLPGFGEEWEEKQLGDVLTFQVGYPFSSKFFNEKEQGLRLVKNRDLKSDDQIFHYSGQYDSSFQVGDGDVLIGMDGDFLPCRWNKGGALLNQRVGRIVPRNSLDRAFAFYYLIEPLKEIEAATSSTTVKHLSHGDVEGITKPLPTLAEQTAIATILTDMDTELAELETRLVKTRQLKQGMMQELLTGRIRLL
ncbi:MAG: restriction endonuclease subunit S [Rhodanobacter sp.]